jgi:hypothetical protein
MATLTISTASIAGALLGATAANTGTAGDQFINDGRVILYIKNASGGARVVTIDAQSIQGYAFTDPTVSLDNAEEKIVGPFNPQYFNDASGYVKFTVDGALTVAPVRIQT